MSEATFQLDPRLAADTVAIAAMPLCELRLMNDARYVWLVLVPRRVGMVEITDLSEDEQVMLWQEVNRVSAVIRTVTPCDKLNLGALGNIVRQLHVHLLARCEGDAAWPGPVWGHSTAVIYPAKDLTALIDKLRNHLSA